MATTVTAFTAQSDAFLRSGGGLKALNAQAKADLLRTLTPDQRALLTVYENAKRVYDNDNGDEMNWSAARALSARLLASANMPEVPLELYNEGKAYQNGKEALGRLLDLFSGNAQPSQTLEAYTQAVTAAKAKQDAIQLPKGMQGLPRDQVDALMAQAPQDDPLAQQYNAARFDQDTFDADYGQRVLGLTPRRPGWAFQYDDLPGLTDEERLEMERIYPTIADIAGHYKDEAQFWKELEGTPYYAQAKRVQEFVDRGVKRDLAQRTRTVLNARAFMNYWMAEAPSLPARANELILRAYKSGTEGIDVEDEDEITLPSTGYESVSNHALYEGLSEQEKKRVLPLLSMARGEVKEPQFWTDLWTRLAQSSDRTFVNPFRFIGAMASDVSTPIGAWLSGRDFDYGAWASGKKEEAQAEAAVRAATQSLTYGDYGILTEGILGTIEQLPIFVVTSAGAALSPVIGGASVYGSAAFLALGYAEDTRKAALERGADPFAASLLGLASGAVQGAIDQIQWGQLAGLADSAMLTVAKRNGAAAFTRAFLDGAVRRVGSPEALRFAQRVGSAYLADVFLECAQEGLQGMTDSLAQDLSLMLSGAEDVDVKDVLGRSLTRFKDEFVQSLPTMMLTVGLAGGTHVVRETARGASAGRALHDLRVGQRETLPLIQSKGLNATELRQQWRTTRGDAARVTLLTEALGSRNAAETAHALFKAEETLADRHRTLAMQQLVDMSSRAGARFAGDPKAIQDMLRGLGLDASVTQAKLADVDNDGKAVSRDGFLVRLRVGDKTIDLGLRAATEEEVSLGDTDADATSAWEAVSKENPEVAKMGKDAFITRWQADADFRAGLIQKHKLSSTGAFAVRPGLSVIVSRTNPETGAVERDALPVGGLILLAQGGLSGQAAATNRSLAHETLHAVVRLLRDGGVLTADSELVKQARALFGDPKMADELFDEEAAATRLAEESGLGMEALDAVAGEVLRAVPDKGVRGLLRRAAGAFMDWLAGGDVVPVVDKEGRVTELTGDTRVLGDKRGEATRGRQLMARLANALDDHAAEASEAWGRLQAARAAQRQATLDALVREQAAKARKAAEKAEAATTEEAKQDAIQEQQAAEAALDAALREQAEARDEQAARQLFALRGYLDEKDRKNPDPKAVIPTLAASFAKLCRQPLPNKPAERNRALADRRAALKKWRDAKNRELDLLKLRAALGVDPSARLEYYVARENEAFRLEAREARKSIDDEKRRVKETPVAEGDALLANTRVVGHVEVESRESFVKRKMAENGWDRKTAIAQSTHLYPEDMQGLGVPPWASKQLYTGAGGHSPDTAAQALYDEGRIADPTVDAFWEAVRGDIETVSLSKQREIEAIEAEAAQAVGRALALHRATLADIDRRDSEGGLPLPSDDFRREVSARAKATTVSSSAISMDRALELLEKQENEVFSNIEQDAKASIHADQRRKLVSDAARAKSHLNGFTDDEHLNAAVKAGELFRYGHLVEDRPGIITKGREKGKEDPNVRIQRYTTSVVIQRQGGPFVAVAYLTVKVSTSYRRPKPNQNEQTPNRIYSLELLELRDPRLQDWEQTSNDVRPGARESSDTIPQSGEDVNPRREVSGLFSGGPVPYDQPNLRYVGSNDGGRVYGWGLYADKVFDVARAFAAGPTAAIHEQRWWTHREPGDESHVLDWELEVTPENRARVLAAVRSLDVTEEELRQIFGRDWATRGMTGEQAYELVVDAVRFFTEADESERTASELLYKHDIDGVHTRDDRSSTYVAFSDEHLQVVRRWIWDAATETFVPDASFLPPAPTPAEAQGRAQAVATVRREATGVLTPRTELALDDLLLRSIVAQEEKRPQDAPFVSGSRIVLPRYDIFFHPDHPNTNAMLFNELLGYQPISMEDIEMGARVLGLDPPLAFEALALQLQHYRDQILKHTTFGERPPHLRGLYRGGPQYVHALPYYGDQTTEDFMQTIHRIEQWRDDLLNAAWIYAELGPGVTIREGVRLPGIHLLKPEDRGWRWREHTLLTPFGKLRLDRKNQHRLTELEAHALAGDHFEAPETRTPREIVKTERYITKLIDFAKQHFGARIVYDCNRDGTDVDLSMTYPNGAEFAFHVEGSYALDKATDKLRHELLAALDGRSTARVPTPRDRLAKANSYTELADFARKALGVDVSYKTRVDGSALVLTGPDGAVETIEIPIKDAVGSRLAQRLRDALEKYLPPPTPDELRDWIAKARALEPLEKIAADYLGTTVSYGEQEEESERVVITLTHADDSTTVLDTNWGVAIEELGRALANRLPQAAVAAPRREVTAAREARVDALVARLQAEKEQVREAYADDWMTAPNGAPTNLTEEQWLLVRTPSFKAWFGDWEHDPEHASKVVDENGEPLVVFHGSRTAGFTVFNKGLGEVHTNAPDSTYWFAQFLADARTYSGSNDLVKLHFDSVEEAIERYALFEEWHVVDEDGLSPRTGAEIFDDKERARRVADEINDDFEDRPYRVVKMWRNVEDNGWEGDEVFTTPEAALAYANDHIAETQHYRANYPVFLNLRNPMVRDFEGYTWNGLGEGDAHFGLWLNEEGTFAEDGDGNPIHFYDESEAADYAGELGLAEGDFEVQPLTLPSTNDLARDALEGGFYDGLVIRNVVDNGGEWGGTGGPGTDYVVFDPRAIKSATENSGAFDPADPDIRREVGSAARLKDAHGDYPDLGDLIASPRFEVGSARALIARALPNLPAEEADRFLAAYDALPDTKRKKAALHWFTRGGLDLPKDEDVFERALKAMDWWKLSFQNFDSPQALLLAANARLAKWRTDKTPDPIDPDTVPELTNKVDLGHGITVYEVQDDAQGQRAMWEIVKSHLGMHEVPQYEDYDRGSRDELDPKHWAFWSPWCLLVPTQSGDRPSRSAEEYWDYYNACPKRAAFKDGRVISFCASEDNAMGEWWDMEDKSHDERIPVTVQVEAAEFGLVDEHADDVSGTVDLETELTIYGELPTGEDLEVAGSVFSRGNKEDGTYEEWFAGGLLRVRETRVDGELEGERVVYDERDNRFIVEHYKGGKLDGVRERRVPGSWELRARSTYKDGHHVGVSEVWHRDGSLAKRYPYDENGERHGDVEEFARNGTCTTLKQYVHGKAHGVFAYWTEDGQLRSIEHWRDGKEDGESLEYRDGVVVTRAEFREGVEIVPSWASREMFGTPFTSEQVTVRDRPYNRLSRFSLYRSEDGTVSRVDFSSVLSGERVEAEFAPDGTLRRRDIQKGDTYVSERYARNGRLVSYTAHRGADDQVEVNAEGEFYATLRKTFNEDPERIDEAVFARLRADYEAELGDLAVTAASAPGLLLDAVNENRARFGLESLPADYSPAPRREVTAAGPHANEPFTYAKSALRKRVDRAQMEGEGTNPIGKRDIVELTDIPPFWLDYGFQKGRLFTIADILRKIKKEHHIDASAFAELPEHYSRPVAILIQNEEWTILTDQLADDGTGRLAPVMLYVRQAKDGTNAYLASAYSRDVAGESAYINKANAGGLLYLDDIRIDALPLAGETKKALLEKWHSGKRTGAPFGPQEELNRSIQTSGESAFTSDNQGNTNTIAQPRANPSTRPAAGSRSPASTMAVRPRPPSSPTAPSPSSPSPRRPSAPARSPARRRSRRPSPTSASTPASKADAPRAAPSSC